MKSLSKFFSQRSSSSSSKSSVTTDPLPLHPDSISYSSSEKWTIKIISGLKQAIGILEAFLSNKNELINLDKAIRLSHFEYLKAQNLPYDFEDTKFQECQKDFYYLDSLLSRKHHNSFDEELKESLNEMIINSPSFSNFNELNQSLYDEYCSYESEIEHLLNLIEINSLDISQKLSEPPTKTFVISMFLSIIRCLNKYEELIAKNFIVLFIDLYKPLKILNEKNNSLNNNMDKIIEYEKILKTNYLKLIDGCKTKFKSLLDYFLLFFSRIAFEYECHASLTTIGEILGRFILRIPFNNISKDIKKKTQRLSASNNNIVFSKEDYDLLPEIFCKILTIYSSEIDGQNFSPEDYTKILNRKLLDSNNETNLLNNSISSRSLKEDPYNLYLEMVSKEYNFYERSIKIYIKNSQITKKLPSEIEIRNYFNLYNIENVLFYYFFFFLFRLF